MTTVARIAVVGTGSMADIYARAIADRRDARLAAIVGNSPDKTAEAGRRFGVPAYANGDVAGALRAQSDLDAFVLATPEWIRMEPLRALLATGKPLLVEKPLAASKAEANELRALDATARARISVAHSLRMSPRFSQACRVVHEGAIGDVRHFYTRRNPSLRSVQRVLGKFDLAYWLSCHDIDLMRWLARSEVEWVHAVSRGGLKTDDDYIIAHLRFANGVDAVHEVSWCSPPLSDQAPACRMSIKGTKGLIEIDDSSTGIDMYLADGRLSSPDTYEAFEVAGHQQGLFPALVDRWIRTVRDGEPAYPGFDDALAAVDVCTMISRSIASGRIEHRTA